MVTIQTICARALAMPETSKKFDLLRKLFVHTVVVDTQDVIMATRKILVESDLKVAILTDEILSFLQKNVTINFLEEINITFCTFKPELITTSV